MIQENGAISLGIESTQNRITCLERLVFFSSSIFLDCCICRVDVTQNECNFLWFLIICIKTIVKKSIVQERAGYVYDIKIVKDLNTISRLSI